MILVFDLDDTLYEEIEFVKSGFRAVSDYLGKNHSINPKKAYAIMLGELEKNGRGKIFNTVLENFNIYSLKEVKKCLTIYRLHKPIISVSKTGERCLKRFKSIKKFIVTDGNKNVQYNKIKALGLINSVDKYFITHRYGIKNAKPSTYCFDKISQLCKEKPGNIVYIADNARKDFVNLKKKGYKTIRVKTGMFKDIFIDDAHEAHLIINSLDELTTELLNKLWKI